MARKPRTTAMGRRRKPRRVEIKKIQNEKDRQSCFSKRKLGLFTKANELSTLCGAKVLVVIYSDAGRPHTFGCPTPRSVMDRFLSRAAGDDHGGARNDHYDGLNRYAMDLSAELERANQKKVHLQQQLKMEMEQNEFARLWSEKPENLNREELSKLMASLEELKLMTQKRIKEQLMSTTTTARESRDEDEKDFDLNRSVSEEDDGCCCFDLNEVPPGGDE